MELSVSKAAPAKKSAQIISSEYPGLVIAEHQRRDFKGALDNGQLPLVQLEIDDLPRLRFLASQVPIHFPSKLFLR